MRSSPWYLAVFAALLAFLPSSAVVSAQTKIAIASPGALSVTSSIPLVIAQEQGLFAKYGLEIRVNVGVPLLVGKESELDFVGAPSARQTDYGVALTTGLTRQGQISLDG